jgi:hypothetical protein
MLVSLFWSEVWISDSYSQLSRQQLFEAMWECSRILELLEDGNVGWQVVKENSTTGWVVCWQRLP